MKLVKNMALVSMGAGAVLAYQKYNKPVMDKMEKMMTSMKKKANLKNGREKSIAIFHEKQDFVKNLQTPKYMWRYGKKKKGNTLL